MAGFPLSRVTLCFLSSARWRREAWVTEHLRVRWHRVLQATYYSMRARWASLTAGQGARASPTQGRVGAGRGRRSNRTPPRNTKSGCDSGRQRWLCFECLFYRWRLPTTSWPCFNTCLPRSHQIHLLCSVVHFSVFAATGVPFAA